MLYENLERQHKLKAQLKQRNKTVTDIEKFIPSNLGPEHDKVLQKLFAVYRDLFRHDGYGTLHLEMRFLKKGQKEVLINCGKEYRFVVNYPGTPEQ